MWKRTVKLTPPYDFERVMERLALDPLNKVDKKESIMWVPLYIDRKPVVIKLKSIGTVEKPVCMVQACQKVGEEAVLNELKRIFQWNVSLSRVNAHFAHTHLAPLFEEHSGTPLVLEFDLYRCLVKSIIHQQINLKVAHTLTERFVHTFGKQMDGVWFYPLPEETAMLRYEDVQALKFSRRKAEYIVDLSVQIASGKLDLNELHSASDEEIMKKLIKVRGIGPWTVQSFLMFGLGRANMFPYTDVGLQNALRQLFALEKKPTLNQMQQWSTEWHPYLSYASLYLWRSIEKRTS
ncbi:DNA-3-methyladenine glycosylase family protein [Bacillus songklensis]|uniref:DNA-3-methyladenine glycosylase II n=1 Tax=Bacillus songklensis TaxID=1069116 RepID=A0ABV8B870_9BACI